jgi:hypothetical protein
MKNFILKWLPEPKHWFIAAIIAGILILTTSCVQTPQESQQVGEPITPVVEEKAERVTLVDNGGTTLLYIYKVDGHEYIASSKGGIIHSESCPCKNQR